jgi:CheY-like chemotaxis protein
LRPKPNLVNPVQDNATPDLPEFPGTVDALRGRVLIADDVPDTACSLATLCQLCGAEVRFAFDGAETVRIAETFRPDVVLMDISMPIMNGYEAARAIRRAPWGQRMVLIALTGWGRRGDREAAENAGFDGHLLKPVELEKLLRLISDLRVRQRGQGQRGREPSVHGAAEESPDAEAHHPGAPTNCYHAQGTVPGRSSGEEAERHADTEQSDQRDCGRGGDAAKARQPAEKRDERYRRTERKRQEGRARRAPG